MGGAHGREGLHKEGAALADVRFWAAAAFGANLASVQCDKIDEYLAFLASGRSHMYKAYCRNKLFDKVLDPVCKPRCFRMAVQPAFQH